MSPWSEIVERHKAVAVVAGQSVRARHPEEAVVVLDYIPDGVARQSLCRGDMCHFQPTGYALTKEAGRKTEDGDEQQCSYIYIIGVQDGSNVMV